MEDNRIFNLVKTSYLVALCISLRIATANEHYADSCTFVELNCTLVEIAFCNAFEQVDNVALKTQHYSLSLRVAHTAVVLDNHRLALYVD